MKFRLLAALFVSLIAAQPALAQTDRLDSGDWWWLDVDGTGTLSAAFLANGEPVRRGDKVELNMFMIFRDPKPDGLTGIQVREVINCAAKTRANGMAAMMYNDGRVLDLNRPVEERGALNPEATIYVFACSTDRTGITHYGPGSRRKITDQLFAEYPDEESEDESE